MFRATFFFVGIIVISTGAKPVLREKGAFLLGIFEDLLTDSEFQSSGGQSGGESGDDSDEESDEHSGEKSRENSVENVDNNSGDNSKEHFAKRYFIFVNFTFADVYIIPTLPLSPIKEPVTALPAIRIPKTETMRIPYKFIKSSSNQKKAGFSLAFLQGVQEYVGIEKLLPRAKNRKLMHCELKAVN